MAYRFTSSVQRGAAKERKALASYIRPLGGDGMIAANRTMATLTSYYNKWSAVPKILSFRTSSC